MSTQVVYAIVRAGGRQEKVSVGDYVTLNRVPGGAGSTLELPALLLVDGDKVTSAAAELANVKVTAEILEDLRGPKIVIQKFKNKTGYKKRQGHRQELTKIKITSIA
ncbi:large subunit ribosomal protein L21 [Paenarthrobacter nicotinovorans]|nr:large subunit ribosomal protein L21 [Paenarthrobacter nicotinovorans]